MNEKHPCDTPTAPEAAENQAPASQHQSTDAPQKIKTVVTKPMDPEMRKRLAAARVPQSEARTKTRELFFQRKFEAAEVECRRAVALVPIINGFALHLDELPLLGDILLAQGRNQEALECYLHRQPLDKPDDPEHPRPNLGAALAYCRLGLFEMAKRYAPDEALAKRASPERWVDGPGSADIRALEASILFEWANSEYITANLHGALLYLEQAAKMAPENWLIALSLGMTLDRLERRDEAVPYYKIAVKYGGDKVFDEARQRAKK